MVGNADADARPSSIPWVWVWASLSSTCKFKGHLKLSISKFQSELLYRTSNMFSYLAVGADEDLLAAELWRWGSDPRRMDERSRITEF